MRMSGFVLPIRASLGPLGFVLPSAARAAGLGSFCQRGAVLGFALPDGPPLISIASCANDPPIDRANTSSYTRAHALAHAEVGSVRCFCKSP